jgi:AcrR family transcriptional regulator
MCRRTLLLHRSDYDARKHEIDLESYIRFNHPYCIVQDPASETVVRILTAAESLFAEHGYAGVSLRQITSVAHVNLAAVNYHFYDKESLWRKIVSRRLQQINQHRLELLDQTTTRPGSAASLADILYALARPLLVPSPTYGLFAPRLVGRLLTERGPFADEILRADFNPAMARFGQAIRRHTPSLPPKDFLWRFSFVVGALHHAAVTLPDMPAHTAGFCVPEDGEIALANFTTFAGKALGA